MKKYLKRICSIAIVSAMAITMAACGNSNSETTNNE